MIWPPILLITGRRYLTFELNVVGWLLWGQPLSQILGAGNPPENDIWMSMGRFMLITHSRAVHSASSAEFSPASGGWPSQWLVVWAAAFRVFRFQVRTRPMDRVNTELENQSYPPYKLLEWRNLYCLLLHLNVKEMPRDGALFALSPTRMAFLPVVILLSVKVPPSLRFGNGTDRRLAVSLPEFVKPFLRSSLPWGLLTPALPAGIARNHQLQIGRTQRVSFKDTPVKDLFASNVFSEEVMRELILPKPYSKSFSRRSRKALSLIPPSQMPSQSR